MLFLKRVLTRLALSIPTLILVLAGLFVLIKFAPGDTVDAMVAQMGAGDPVMMAKMREFYGLDTPIWQQLISYLQGLFTLDLGFSAIYGKPVTQVIFERLGTTLLLMGSALCFAFSTGLALGVIAARKVNGITDTIISTLGLIFYATPSFWFGLMSIVLFAVNLSWLPSGGFGTVGAGLQGWDYIFDVAKYLVLPTLTLGLGFLAIYLRIMRASMLEVLSQDFVRTARAKGLSEYKIIYRHVLRNALLPMITLVGLQAGTLIGGSVVVESVFAIPGLGRLAYESVIQRDLNTLLGITFVSAILVIIVNFIVDLAYTKLDPRMDKGAAV